MDLANATHYYFLKQNRIEHRLQQLGLYFCHDANQMIPNACGLGPIGIIQDSVKHSLVVDKSRKLLGMFELDRLLAQCEYQHHA